MAVHIIVDGYNLIRQSKTLRLLDQQDLEAGRDALVHKLAAYKRIKSHKITVVFDGAQAPHLAMPRDRIRGISIEFSRKGESADTVIKRLASREKQKALVVSSDRDVANTAAFFGAATIDSEEFEVKMAMANDMGDMESDDGDHQGWTPTTKKKGPSKRLPKRRRRNRIKINKL
jgi:predicted RNA-binding protein with PIN domain